MAMLLPQTDCFGIRDDASVVVKLGRRCSYCVHKYVTLGELLNILLKLGELEFARFLLGFLADRVDLLNVSDRLILLMDDFPLLFQSGD